MGFKDRERGQGLARGSMTPWPRPAGGTSEKGSQASHWLRLAPSVAVLRFAAPTTGVMLVAALSNVLYTYYVSRLGSEAIAAVSLVFPVSLIAITAIGGGLGAGTGSAVARALGGEDPERAALIAMHAVILAVLAGVLFGLSVWLGARTLFHAMGGRGVVLEQAVVFARWLFAGSAIAFSAQVIDSVLRGEGNVRTPALWSTVSLALQMLLTPVFMFWLHGGLAAAALGMVVAQGIALVPRLAHFERGKSALPVRQAKLTWSHAVVREIFQVGVPASLSTTINYVGLMALTSIIARYGDTHLAAYGLGTRMDFLLLSLSYGFGSGVLTLVGFVAGAGRPGLAPRYVRSAGLWILALLGSAGFLLFSYSDGWLTLFTSDPEVLEVGRSYFRLVAPSYPFVGVSMVMAFAFQGLGWAHIPFAWTALRVTLVVSAATVGARLFSQPASTVFLMVSVANVLSAGVLASLFRMALRTRSRTAT